MQVGNPPSLTAETLCQEIKRIAAFFIKHWKYFPQELPIFDCRLVICLKTEDEHILRWLEGQGTASVAEFRDLYKRAGYAIPEATLRWKLHYWTEQGRIYRVGRGRYAALGQLTPFKALPSNHLLECMAWYLKGRLREAAICIWDTKILSSYSLHVPARSFGIVEVGRYEREYALEALLNNDYLGPFAYDDNRSGPFVGHLGRSRHDKRPVVVKLLLQEAPMEDYHGLLVPTIEKLIVDLICEPEFFGMFQSKDLESILESFHYRHPINYDKLHHYASYRSQAGYVMDKVRPYWHLQTKSYLK